MSGWYILLKLIPVFSIAVSIYLYCKKGNFEMNEYDKAIAYDKLFKDKRCINIYDNMFIVDGEEYQYDLHLNKYIIKISKYGKDNFFTGYLLSHYQPKEIQIYKTVEIEREEFDKLVEQLGFVVISNSHYVNFRGFKIFIRKEDFRYTMILDKNTNKVTKELFDTFDFPGTFYEDAQYIYYRKVYKNDLLKWVGDHP
jgi:predicted MPP superfamily phosphohydrolase